MIDGVPCAPFPDDASYKTIAVYCDACGSGHTHSTACWLAYLRWEMRCGITLNKAHHHLVAETL